MSADLDLARVRPAPTELGRADLDVGPVGPVDTGAATLDLVAEQPAPAAQIHISPASQLDLAIIQPAPGITLGFSYDVNVWRGLTSSARAPHRSALPIDTRLSSAWRSTRYMQHTAGPVWQIGQRRASDAAAPWHPMHRLRSRPTLAWREARPLNAGIVTEWQYLARHRPALATPWHASAPRRAAYSAHWRYPQPRPSAKQIIWHETRPRHATLAAPASRARPLHQPSAIPWRDGRRPAPGYWIRPVLPVQPIQPPQPTGSVTLDLVCRYILAHVIGPDGAVRLRLPPCGEALPDGPVIVPQLEIYLVINTITLTRMSDGMPIPCMDLSLRMQADGPHLAWDATVPGWIIDAVRPPADPQADPVVLVAHINGTATHLRVQSHRRRRGFADDSWTLSGRGLTAELSDAAGRSNHVNASVLTLSQAASAALPWGWTLDWQAGDPLIPAGRWAHHGTPIEAVVRLAQTLDAWIRPDLTGRNLTVLPRYPAASWRWASDLTPDITLPIDAVELEDQDIIDLPGYNVVDVIGDKIYRTRRQGTAGNDPAPQIVEPLLFDALAARDRAIGALSPVGRQLTSTYRLLVMPEYGSVLQPGQILDLQDGDHTRRGIIRSTRVDVTDIDNVTQTIGVESYDV